jgi:hypothetical protein
MRTCCRLRAASRHHLASPARMVVLGSRDFAPHGLGFGAVRPRRLSMGDDLDPTKEARVDQIRWRRWGGPTATGHGLTALAKPDGGFYRKKVRIELRADRLGRCTTALGLPDARR